MKKIIALITGALFLLAACNSGSNKKEDNKLPDTTAKETTIMKPSEEKTDSAGLYACPMHPEITGHLNDKCRKCGMKLTELVKK